MLFRSPEFKGAGNRIYLLCPRYRETPEGAYPDFESVKETFARMQQLIAKRDARSVWAIGAGGALEGLCKMAFGNRIGFKAADGVSLEGLLKPVMGGFLFESEIEIEIPGAVPIGVTTPDYSFALGGERVSLLPVQAAYENKLAPVYPYLTPEDEIGRAHV